MFIIFIRTVILFTIVIIVMRLMGKRQIGELQPHELAVTILISDLASLPMQDTRLPLLLGVIPMLTLLLLKMIISQIQLKSQIARKIIDGEPAILIYKSKINYNALKKQQINIDELMEEIRLAGYFDLEEIQYAILETNGQVSILPKGLENDPIETKFDISYPKRHELETEPKKDINSSSEFKTIKTMSGNDNSDGLFLPKVVISDGKINRNSLTRVNKDKYWIESKLKEYGINDIKEVLVALYDTQGNFKYQLYDEYEKEIKN